METINIEQVRNKLAYRMNMVVEWRNNITEHIESLANEIYNEKCSDELEYQNECMEELYTDMMVCDDEYTFWESVSKLVESIYEIKENAHLEYIDSNSYESEYVAVVQGNYNKWSLYWNGISNAVMHTGYVDFMKYFAAKITEPDQIKGYSYTKLYEEWIKCADLKKLLKEYYLEPNELTNLQRE